MQVKWSPLSVNVISLEFFDRLSDPGCGIVGANGYLKRMMDEDIKGIMCSDELREMLLHGEESEQHAEVYSAEEQNEFIFRIFR